MKKLILILVILNISLSAQSFWKMVMFDEGEQIDYAVNESFSDGDYTGWTVEAGGFSVDNAVANPLSDNDYSLLCGTAGRISIPCTQAYGTWEFDFYKATASTNYFHVISNSTAAYNGFNGYMFYLNTSEGMGLYKVNTGSGNAQFLTATPYYAESTFYRIKVFRDINGQFTVSVKGGAFGANYIEVSETGGSGSNPVTENTYTTSAYFVIDLDAGDRVSNIQIY